MVELELVELLCQLNNFVAFFIGSRRGVCVSTRAIAFVAHTCFLLPFQAFAVCVCVEIFSFGSRGRGEHCGSAVIGCDWLVWPCMRTHIFSCCSCAFVRVVLLTVGTHWFILAICSSSCDIFPYSGSDDSNS